MDKAYVLRGKICSSTRIELNEPVNDLRGEVDIVILPPSGNACQNREDVFKLIAKTQPGSRTKKEIDLLIKEERAAWGD